MSLIPWPCRAEIPNFNTDDASVLQNALDASSEFVERYCNRTFALTTYDELLRTAQASINLLLDEYPISKSQELASIPLLSYR